MDKENMNSHAPDEPGTVPKLKLSMEPSIFRSKYQRNNKRGGLKNLRCFPTCGATHRARGFCGRSIQVKIAENEANLDTIDWNRSVCVGEFTQMDAANRFAIGECIPAKTLYKLKRSPEMPALPLVFGERWTASKDSKPVSFEFNRKRKGWHYGWSSNKHSCNTEHCFRVYVLQEINAAVFRVLDSVSSTPFVLFCRRRRRFHMEPSAPEGPPASKRTRRTPLLATAPPVKSEDVSFDTTATAECLVSLANVCNELCRSRDTLADSSVPHTRELVMS